MKHRVDKDIQQDNV